MGRNNRKDEPHKKAFLNFVFENRRNVRFGCRPLLDFMSSQNENKKQNLNIFEFPIALVMTVKACQPLARELAKNRNSIYDAH